MLGGYDEESLEDPLKIDYFRVNITNPVDWEIEATSISFKGESFRI